MLPIAGDGTSQGASAYARAQVAGRTTGWHNQCLRFVRTACGAPARGGWARRAWDQAEHRHPGDRNPPAGVPMFFDGGRYGHTALSRLEGHLFTTDAVVDDQVRPATIAFVEQRWGMRYLGWTGDVNAQRVKDVGKPRVTMAHVTHAIDTKAAYVGIQTIAYAMRREGLGGFRLNGKWGAGKRRAYKRWQTRWCKANKLPVNAKTCDGIPGRGSLTALAAKHGFTLR